MDVVLAGKKQDPRADMLLFVGKSGENRQLA